MNTIEYHLEKLSKKDGYTESYIPGVSFLKTTLAMQKAPMMYGSRIIIVGRGEKRGYLNGKILHYNADNYLILSIPMPFECDAQEDVLALVIDIDLKLLGDVVSQIPKEEESYYDIEEAVSAIPLDSDFTKSIIRLLEISYSQEESKILGDSILKEILYRALKGKHGKALLALYEKEGKFARFAQLINKINNEMSSNYTLKYLADYMIMSETSLYRYFKKLTSQSPLQYIKHTRLQKAQELIIEKKLSLKEICKTVGYKSLSQFSREYKTYFGITPKKTI